MLRIAAVFATSAASVVAVLNQQPDVAERCLLLTAILALDWRVAWLSRRMRDAGIR